MKGKCKYCGKELLDIANIRCDNCDRAWANGYRAGEEEIKDKIRRAFGFLKSFVV